MGHQNDDPILTDADHAFVDKITPIDDQSLLEAIAQSFPTGLPPDVPSWAELLLHAVT
jgi:hypothetical protein